MTRSCTKPRPTKLEVKLRKFKWSERRIHQIGTDLQSLIFQLWLYIQQVRPNFHLLWIQSLPRIHIGRPEEIQSIYEPSTIVLQLLHLYKPQPGWKKRAYKHAPREEMGEESLPDWEGGRRREEHSQAQWEGEKKGPTREKNRPTWCSPLKDLERFKP